METVGEVYMAVGGAPEPNLQHPEIMARLAIAIRDAVPKIDAALPIVIKSGK